MTNIYMSLPEIIALTIVEIIGDFGYKEFANKGGLIPFIIGTFGYIGVVIMLIISLQGSTILMVNSAWDGISGLLESACAYIFLGERFQHFSQYIGILLIALGLYLLKIPLEKKHKFVFPNIFS
jgi:multidrug transporter EmrE-like cation transporter